MDDGVVESNFLCVEFACLVQPTHLCMSFGLPRRVVNRRDRGFPPRGSIFYVAEIKPPGGKCTTTGGIFCFPPLPGGESTPGGLFHISNFGTHKQTAVANAQRIK